MGAIDTSYTFTATDVITSAKMNNIMDQSIMTATAIIGDTLAVTTGKLFVKAGGITSNEIGANAVTTNSITDANVTTAKIADLNVTTGKIADSSITAVKLATNSVETVKIKDANVTATKLDGAQPSGPPIYGARAWAMFGPTGTVLSSGGNVATVTNPSNGYYSVTFSTNMPNVNYSILINPGGYVGNEGVYFASVTSRTVSGFTFVTARATDGTSSGDLTNMASNGSLVVFG